MNDWQQSMDFQRAMGMTTIEAPFLSAHWPAPARVKTCISTRRGGVSQGVYASLNVGMHVGDDPLAVAHNRALLAAEIPVPVAYLQQTHSTDVVAANAAWTALQAGMPLVADASVNKDGYTACAVMTADCLPVLLCDRAGTVVAAAHAGWRGLAAGVLANTVAAMQVPAAELMAWLGPAIGADAFEVGQDVWDAFCLPMPVAAAAFTDIGEGKYLADIYALARLVLRQAGVTAVYGGQYCTVLQRDDFFSYRRDGQTGRMVSVVWLAD